MKLQFDPNQQFQLDAVSAVVDLFEDHPYANPDFAVVKATDWGDLIVRTEGSIAGACNQLLVDEDRLRKNLRSVQDRYDLEVGNPDLAPEAWELLDPVLGQERRCPQFSVEMETGTGKTYVYLRTIFELSQRYGFQKFIVVVPSVAIREGVLENIRITTEHFRALYNSMPFEHFVYDSDKVNRLRQFAHANTLQIMIINIDAFRKNFTGTEEEQKGNVIYKESDRLSGRQPIEFVQAARPIVIIDEPQSVDSTEKAQEAIKALNPLCVLRYSATHRNLYNLVYRLDPIRAFEMRLVKQIVVASTSSDPSGNDALVLVENVNFKTGVKARVRINLQGPHGPREKAVIVRLGSDLHEISNGRAEYETGFTITEINAEPGNEYVQFANGRALRIGEQLGGLRHELWRAQLKHTIKRHLEKELQLRGRGIKVLSLFFIDRVANYRDYDAEGNAIQGQIAISFEQELASFAKDPRYADLLWLREPPEKLHNGYFAIDKKGLYRESREGRDAQADDLAYVLIMQAKERLLSLEEPLRFIFSHSALREGWDNPNVFQICTLNETRSVVKKRQEIGRGLRLPVNQEGVRVFDDSINKLYVVANESYEDFARKLQTEYENDCGVTFGKIPLNAFARLLRVVNGTEVSIGREAGEEIRSTLVKRGFLDATGHLQSKFDPRRKDFDLDLPDRFDDLTSAVIDLMSTYQIERHVLRERNDGVNHLRKQVQVTPEFRALWERIKPRTTYRIEFETETLLDRGVSALKNMDAITKPRIRIAVGQLGVQKGGVTTTAVSAGEDQVETDVRTLPDVLAYLQNETGLTRSTLARILVDSGRLAELLKDPQRFLDSVAALLKVELRRLLVDGIKYERIEGTGPEAEWEMLLFRNEELINYLTALRVEHSLYDYVAYDSEIEREFARKLDEREDIKLFVKLPSWFQIDTPVGKYNPDWAIVKQNGETLYLVRETKGTRDVFNLRTTEADKLRCGKKHFETLGVPFDVVKSPDEV